LDSQWGLHIVRTGINPKLISTTNHATTGHCAANQSEETPSVHHMEILFRELKRWATFTTSPRT